MQYEYKLSYSAPWMTIDAPKDARVSFESGYVVFRGRSDGEIVAIWRPYMVRSAPQD